MLRGESTQFLRNFTTLYLQPFNILETAEELEILELSSDPKIKLIIIPILGETTTDEFNIPRKVDLGNHK
jgi:hypothetical protein